MPDYPGNIRGWRVVENAAPAESRHHPTPTTCATSPSRPVHRCLNTLKDNTDTHIAYVLAHTRGNRRQAAEILGVTVRQLQRQLARMKRDPRWEGQIR